MSEKLIIPETWDTLEEFAHWFRNNGFPMRVPADMQVYVTDNSYSCVVFRQGVYQAELYMIAPSKDGHPHSHGFENITIPLGGSMIGKNNEFPEGRSYDSSLKEEGASYQDIISFNKYPIGNILKENEWHNIDVFEQGCLIYVLQRWHQGEKMTSAIINYKGEPMGPVHAEFIKEQ